ncbi:DUF6114 domain-containing protein [Streptomyces sp. NPDC003077]|uniref:DUF6114 domain-containing protein n=1 Tax=Streptomyces sp. NPDC003077 TaxID=3154443 RepID=UPI0033B6B080
MSADTRPRLTGGFSRTRSSFRGWRGRRPFWAGLWTLLAGLPIMYFPYANLQIGSLSLRLATTAGAGSLIIGVLLIVLGLTMWFQPVSRVFAGVAAILLALVSLVVSNFGGFVMGFLLGLIGGALAVAWAPGKPVPAGGDESGDPAEPGDGPSPGPPSEASAPAGGAVVDLTKKSPIHGTNGRHSAG